MRALVAGWIGSTNLGDELVFRGLCRHLDALGVTSTAVSIDPAATMASHGVAAVAHTGPRDTPRLWMQARDQDVIIFGGGGLIQDQTSAWNLPFHLTRLAAARRWGRPWAGIGLGIDTLRTRAARALAQIALRGATGVTVRDVASAHAARSIGLTPVVGADLALALDPPPPSAPGRVVVALRAPTRSGFGTAAGKSLVPPDDMWVRQIGDALDKVAAELDSDVSFVSFQRDRDRSVHERVASHMRRPAMLVEPDLDTVLHEIAAGQLVITMRYHGAISALLAGRPAVLIDYSQKMANLSRDLAGAYPVVDTANAGADTLLKAASAAVRQSGSVIEHRDRLREREQTNRRMVERLLDAAK